MARRWRGGRLLAAVGLAAGSPTAQAQMAGVPSPNSLLNDLRALQFPPAGGAVGQAAAGWPPAGAAGFGGLGAAPQGGGLGFGGLGATGAGGGLGLAGLGSAGATGIQFGGMPQGFGAAGVSNPPFGGMPQAGTPGLGFGMGAGFPGTAGGGAQGQGLGFGMPQGRPQDLGRPGVREEAAPEIPEDMACELGPRAAGWAAAKRRFRSLFNAPGGSPLQLASRETMVAALNGALMDLKAVEALSPQAADECGLGKLCLQLLSFATADDPAALVDIFAGLEQLASPVLTLLLDIPWAATGLSGWPLLGLLSQLNLRKSHVPGALNNEDLDGLNDLAGRTFQAELIAALQAGSHVAVERSGAAYLQKEAQGSALAPLTAIAAQAFGLAGAEKLGMLQALQQGFRQVVGNGAELDIATSTHWPLWGLLQLSLDSFYRGE